MIRSLPIFLFITLILLGCHTEAIREPRPVDLVLSRISGTWHATSVALDNVKQPGYDTYNITFSEASDDRINYKMSIWPVVAELPDTGILNPGPNIESELEMQDGFIINYAVEDSKLSLSYSSRAPKTGSPAVMIKSGWTIEYEKVN